MKIKATQNTNIILRKKTRFEDFKYPDFKTYWKATAIMRIQNKENYIDQENKIESKNKPVHLSINFQ